MLTKTTDDLRLEAYVAVAEAWNAFGIPYAVMTGLFGYPKRIDRDLDVLVATDWADQAVELARRVLMTRGYTVAAPPATWGRRWLVAADREDWNTSLEIDFAVRLHWRGILFRCHPLVTTSVGPFPVDPWASWAKGVLLRWLGGDAETAVRRHRWFFVCGNLVVQVTDELTKLLSRPMAHRILAHLTAGDTVELGKASRQVRWSLLSTAVRSHPGGIVVSHIQALRRRAESILAHTVPVVALVGPDGVGKSTVVNLLKHSSSIFAGVVVRHWRPGLLPTLGRLAGRPDPHPEANGLLPPRRHPGRSDALRAAYYGLDYWLGYWLRDRVDTGRQRLVVYDRHALDMVVNPVRYGMRSARAARIMARPVPRPDLIVALTADPRIVVERKPELSVEEVETQNAAWLELYRQGHVDAVVDASRPPEEIAENLRRLIMAKFIAMHGPNRNA